LWIREDELLKVKQQFKNPSYFVTHNQHDRAITSSISGLDKLMLEIDKSSLDPHMYELKKCIEAQMPPPPEELVKMSVYRELLAFLSKCFTDNYSGQVLSEDISHIYSKYSKTYNPASEKEFKKMLLTLFAQSLIKIECDNCDVKCFESHIINPGTNLDMQTPYDVYVLGRMYDAVYNKSGANINRFKVILGQHQYGRIAIAVAVANAIADIESTIKLKVEEESREAIKKFIPVMAIVLTAFTAILSNGVLARGMDLTISNIAFVNISTILTLVCLFAIKLSINGLSTTKPVGYWKTVSVLLLIILVICVIILATHVFRASE